ncbi:MAG: hypothetical protein K8R53_00715 [Bacteroidales bacterium]|nr:hypothetical protein [Bacteroidales bacterium]
MRNKEKYFKEERDKIVKGLEESYKKLIEYKKQKNSPFIVLRDGKILEINPNELPQEIIYGRKTA